MDYYEILQSSHLSPQMYGIKKEINLKSQTRPTQSQGTIYRRKDLKIGSSTGWRMYGKTTLLNKYRLVLRLFCLLLDSLLKAYLYKAIQMILRSCQTFDSGGICISFYIFIHITYKDNVFSFPSSFLLLLALNTANLRYALHSYQQRIGLYI